MARRKGEGREEEEERMEREEEGGERERKRWERRREEKEGVVEGGVLPSERGVPSKRREEGERGRRKAS